MAAIVRSGARRLAGSAGALIQRPPAASGPSCIARFMSSKEPCKRLADEIQAKKEELYDLIAVTENSVHTDFTNRRLLRTLSAHVEPRPDDDQWCFMRASKTRGDIIRPVGIVTGLLAGSASLFVLYCVQDISQDVINKRKERRAAKAKLV